MLRTLILFLLFQFNVCHNINKLFENINDETTKFNAMGAQIAWKKALGEDLTKETESYQKRNILWQQNVCNRVATLYRSHLLNVTQARQTYLLCRGPKYTYNEARDLTQTYDDLQKLYSGVKICIPNDQEAPTDLTMENLIISHLSTIKQFFHVNDVEAAKLTSNFDKDGICLEERDIEKIMETSRNYEVLQWVWLSWREKVRVLKRPLNKLAMIENAAAERNGYHDIGEAWRDESEVPNLRQLSHKWYTEIRPLYELLHGVIRYYLRLQYGDVVPDRGAIPVHLLGDLWSQNWEHLAELIIPNMINLDDRIKMLNWTVKYMVERTEDYYVSLGLPRMPDSFWRDSIFTKENKTFSCQGSAADMYKDNDVRLLYCSGTDFQDFRILHHELGHIQYFMAYKDQPGLFRQGNTAIHESIGDAIINGASTPQHLHRLRIITDEELYKTGIDEKGARNNPYKPDDSHEKSQLNKNNNYDGADNLYNIKGIHEFDFNSNEINLDDEDFDLNDLTVSDTLILKQALNKLPQIPYSLLIEEYRWRYFEGSIDRESLNQEFWNMAHELMGIKPPVERTEDYFDIGAEIHVADNTPFIRYYLSNFVQHQIFESLCRAAVFGRRNANQDLPDTIPLNKCDIYGSKTVGKILKDLMSRGNSQHWQTILNATIGVESISTSSILRYYRPLRNILIKLVDKYRIPIGW